MALGYSSKSIKRQTELEEDPEIETLGFFFEVTQIKTLSTSTGMGRQTEWNGCNETGRLFLCKLHFSR